MATVISHGLFRPVTDDDRAKLDIESPFRDAKIPNWINEDDELLFPTIRDAMADSSLAIVVGEDNVVFAYGSGRFAPPAYSGGRLYELPGFTIDDADLFRMKLFDPETGTASSLPEPPLTRLWKADIWRRTTDAEAEALEAMLATAPVRLRRIFEAAQYLDIDDADYPALRSGIVAVLGEERAAEVLTPTH